MSDQRIKASVLRNDVKSRRVILDGEYADVVGNVEIESIGAPGFQEHVLGIRSQSVKRCRKSNRNFRLARAQEQFDFEMAATKQRELLGLDVLVVYEHKVGRHCSARGHVCWALTFKVSGAPRRCSPKIKPCSGASGWP